MNDGTDAATMPDRPPAPHPPARSMMIKGLVPALPERGKVKVGVKGAQITSKQGNTFQPPKKLDHFVVTTMDRGPDGNFKRDEAAHARLGAEPKDLPVRLLYDDPTLNFPTRYACYVGRTLWCSGDGEQAMRIDDEKKQTRSPVSCPCPRKEPGYQGRDKCKMNGNLSVLIDGVSGVGGVWKFRTTSYNSITGLLSTMAFIRHITGGPLANIPFNLTVRPKEGTAPDGTKVTVYVVGLEYQGDVSALQKIGHTIALDRATTHISIAHIEDEARRLLLAAPIDVPLPGDDPDDTVDEFYPPTEADGPAPPRPTRAEFEAAPTVVDAVDTEAGSVEPDEPAADVNFAAWEQWASEFLSDLSLCMKASDVDDLLNDSTPTLDALQAEWPDKATALRDAAKDRRAVWASAAANQPAPDGADPVALARKYGGPIKGIERALADATGREALDKAVAGYGTFLGALQKDSPEEHARLLAAINAKRAAIKGAK